MGLVTQTIEHLLSGVTQRPGVQRAPEQLELADNMLGRLGHGLMKRPPTVFENGSKYTATLTGWDDAFVHPINRTDTSRFRLVIVNNTLLVFDALTGSASTVETPDGVGYISGTGPFRAVTVGDSTFIVNTATTVKRGSTKFARDVPKALITVIRSEYDMHYSVTLGGESFTIRTPAADKDTERRALSQELIATEIENEILGRDSFQALLALRYTIVRKGATLLITRKSENVPFEIEVADGLGGKALQLIRGEVQAFADLPPVARDGMIVKVIGDPISKKDDYWVIYTDVLGQDQGKWVETGEPGTFRDFDATTMPHQLVAQGLRFVKDIVMEKAPFEPISSYTRDQLGNIGWIFDPLQGTLARADVTVLSLDGDKRHSTNLTGSFPEALLATVRFDVDTTQVENGVSTEVELFQFDDSAGTEISIAAKQFAPGQKFIDQVLSGTKTFDTSDHLRIVLTYQGKATPPRTRRAKVNLPPWFDASAPDWRPGLTPISITRFLETNITFLTTVTYLKGTRITIDLNSGADVFTFNVTDVAGETGTALATRVQVAIDADSSYAATNAVPGVVKISNLPANKLILPAIVHTFWPAANLTFVNVNMGLTINELAGLTLRNITDGSTATIASNTATTITVSPAPTDGVDNDYQTGDICRVEGTGTYFVFEQVPWKDRGVGNDDTNAYPSFMGATISEVFFFRNRLGFTSKETVTLSESGDLFDLFRNTVTDVLDADRIDIKSASASVSEFHSAVVWNKRLFLWADNGQFELGGEPILSANTVFLRNVGAYGSTPKLKPLEAGDGILFAHSTRGSVRVFQWQAAEGDSEAPAKVTDLTVEIPDLIAGEVTDWAVDPTLGILALATDSVRSDLYIFAWTRFGEQILQAGWFRWQFSVDTKIDAMVFQDGKLSMTMRHQDGVYQELLDFDTDLTPPLVEQVSFLNRRLQDDTTGVSSVFSAGDTEFTIPYSINVDQVREGFLTVARRTWPYTRYSVTRSAGTKVKVAGVDLTSVAVYIGLLYEGRARLSPIYLRGRQDGKPATRGRLMLKNVEIHYHDSTDFDIEVTPPNGLRYTRSIKSVADPQEFEDDFNRFNRSLDNDGGWAEDIGGEWNIISNKANSGNTDENVLTVDLTGIVDVTGEHWVQGFFLSDNTVNGQGIISRFKSADPTNSTYYLAQINHGLGQVTLWKRLDGVGPTNLKQVNMTVPLSPVKVRLVVTDIGSNVNLQILVNDVEILSFLDTTNPITGSAYTRAGFRQNNPSFVDDFRTSGGVSGLAPRDGVIRVAAPGKAEKVRIDLVNATPGGFRVSSVDWEGWYHNRAGAR